MFLGIALGLFSYGQSKKNRDCANSIAESLKQLEALFQGYFATQRALIDVNLFDKKILLSSGGLYILKGSDGLSLVRQATPSSREFIGHHLHFSKVEALETYGGVVTIQGRVETGNKSFYEIQFQSAQNVLAQRANFHSVTYQDKKQLQIISLPNEMGKVFWAKGSTSNAVALIDLDRVPGAIKGRGYVAFNLASGFIKEISLTQMKESGVPLISIVLQKTKKYTERVFVDLREAAFDFDEGQAILSSKKAVTLNGQAPYEFILLDNKFKNDYMFFSLDEGHFQVNRVLFLTQKSNTGLKIVAERRFTDEKKFRKLVLKRETDKFLIFSMLGSKEESGSDLVIIPSSWTVFNTIPFDVSESSKPIITSETGWFELARKTRIIPIEAGNAPFLLEKVPYGEGVGVFAPEDRVYSTLPVGYDTSVRQFGFSGGIINKFSSKHPLFSVASSSMLFADIKSNSGKKIAELIWDLDATGVPVIMPPLKKVLKFERRTNGPVYLLIGKANGKKAPFFICFYSPNQHQFILLAPLQSQKYFDSDLSLMQSSNSKAPFIGFELPFEGSEGFEVKFLSHSHLVLTGSLPFRYGYERGALVIDTRFHTGVVKSEETGEEVLQNSFAKWVLGNLKFFDLEQDKVLVGSRVTSGESLETTYQKVNPTQRIALAPIVNKGSKNYTLHEVPLAEGLYDKVFLKNEMLFFGGMYGLVSRDFQTETSYDPINKRVVYTTVGLENKFLYEDADVTVKASKAVDNVSAKLLVTYKKNQEIREVALTEFGTEDDPENQGEQQRAALKQMQRVSQAFGFDVGGFKERVPTLDVLSVKRYKDLLLVETKMVDSLVTMTFFYSLKREKSIFLLPNLHAIQAVNGRVFFLSQATAISNSYIAVFSIQDQQVRHFFDLGSLEIKVNEKGNFFEIDSKKEILKLHSIGDGTRIYNERTRSFQGLLPPELVSASEENVSKMGSNLNAEYFANPPQPAFQRDREVIELERSFPLSVQNKSRRILIAGRSGSGTEEIVQDYISRYIVGKLQQNSDLKCFFLKIDPSKISSGTMYRGTFADKFVELEELSKIVGRYGYRLVLVIPNIEDFLLNGDLKWGDDEGDVFSQLTSLLRNNSKLDVIATINTDVADRLEREHPAFYSLIEKKLRVDALPPKETIKAAEDFLAYESSILGREIKVEAHLLSWLVERIATLSPHQSFPGSVLKVLKNVMKELESEGDPKSKIILKKECLVRALAHQTGVPSKLIESKNNFFSEMESYLNRRVKDQEQAIKPLVSALRAFRYELSRSDWPIARLLLLGPTGVGKTEIVRALVDFLFEGRQEVLFKVSGEDYQDPGAEKKLKVGILKHIKKNPFNVILFDEFEKMCTEAKNMLLSLGDGMMEDVTGVKVSSALSIIILTSNAGSERVQAASDAKAFGLSSHLEREFSDGRYLGLSKRELEEIYRQEIERGFPAPVLGRFKPIICNAVSKQGLWQILRSYLNSEEKLSTASIKMRLKNQGIGVEFEDSVFEFFEREYLNSKYGARGLDRFIEETLVNEFLAKHRSEMVVGTQYRIIYDRQAESFLIK